MSNELVPSLPLAELGSVLVKSGFFADVRQESQAIVKILAGRELGFGPVQSMTGIHIIKGRPTLGAGMIAAAIKRTTRYNYRVLKLDDKVCEIEFFERFNDNWTSLGKSSFTAADAYKADTQNMAKYPRNMLFARAISNGAKWYCPDVFNGPIYTPEELGDAVVDVECVPMVPVAGKQEEVATMQSPPPAVVVSIPPGFARTTPPEAGNPDRDLADYINTTLTPCLPIQIDFIKKQAVAAYGSQEKAGAALKAALAKRCKTKLAELNQAQAAELITKLVVKTKPDF